MIKNFTKDLEEALGITVEFQNGTYCAYCSKFPSRSVVGYGSRDVEARYDLVCRILISTSTQLQTALRILEKDPKMDYVECDMCGLKDILEIFYLFEDQNLCKNCSIRFLMKKLNQNGVK